MLPIVGEATEIGNRWILLIQFGRTPSKHSRAGVVARYALSMVELRQGNRVYSNEAELCAISCGYPAKIRRATACGRPRACPSEVNGVPADGAMELTRMTHTRSRIC